MLDQAVTRDEASEFGIEEMLFSRTDERGVIRAGNEVFFRVSKYPVDELIDAPHKKVRHPDMPKAVFWLMWNMLGRGKPIGAYVKNRASDGSFYWVFAMVAPRPGGFLSIRIKPSSDRLEMIEEMYGRLRSQELTEDLSAEDSAKRMLAELEEQGWSSYSAFMTQALVDETKARSEAMGGQSDRQSQDIAEVQSDAFKSLEIAQSILNSFATIAGFPVNMHIQASKLKSSGKIFGTIADNYERLSRRIEECMRSFIEARRTTSETVDDGLFQLMLAKYAMEMESSFEREAHQNSFYANDLEDTPQGSGLDHASEAQMLTEQRVQNLSDAAAGLTQISSEYKKFSRLINDMLGILSGLSVTQFVGLVETARLNSSGQTLNAMLQDVTNVQNEATENLKQLAALNTSITARIKSLSSAL